MAIPAPDERDTQMDGRPQRPQLQLWARQLGEGAWQERDTEALRNEAADQERVDALQREAEGLVGIGKKLPRSLTQGRAGSG